MKAVIFSDVGKFEVIEKPVPKIKNDNEVLVHVEAASICGSDVGALADPPAYVFDKGVVLGHEFVGKVVEAGSNVKKLAVGDRVACMPNIACGHCDMCELGYPNLCRNLQSIGGDLDGGFAEYVVLPESATAKVPADMPTDLAVFSEPVKCVMGGLSKFNIVPGETVLLIGCGTIGACLLSLLKAKGAGKVIVSEKSDYRGEFARKLGADVIINPDKDDMETIIMETTDGKGVDISVEATGTAMLECIEYTRPAGKVLLMGMNATASQPICQQHVAHKDLTLYGSYIGKFIAETTVKLLDSGLVDFTKLITQRYDLADFGKGLEDMRAGEAIEVILYTGAEVVK